jgi:hypothetical protein
MNILSIAIFSLTLAFVPIDGAIQKQPVTKASAAKGSEITGIVLDKKTNAPVVNAQVLACKLQRSPKGGLSSVIDNEVLKRQGRTDKNGRFRIKGLPLGEYTLMVNMADVRGLDGKALVTVKMVEDGSVVDIGKVFHGSK